MVSGGAHTFLYPTLSKARLFRYIFMHSDIGQFNGSQRYTRLRRIDVSRRHHQLVYIAVRAHPQTGNRPLAARCLQAMTTCVVAKTLQQNVSLCHRCEICIWIWSVASRCERERLLRNVICTYSITFNNTPASPPWKPSFIIPWLRDNTCTCVALHRPHVKVLR